MHPFRFLLERRCFQPDGVGDAKSVEERISDTIDATLGDTNDDTQGDGGGEDQIDGQDAQSQQHQNDGGQQTGAQGQGKPQGGSPNKRAQQQPAGNKAAAGSGQTQQQKPQPGTQQQQARQKANPGDLVDGQGNVIARAGVERRHYEARMHAEHQVGQLQASLNVANNKLQAYEKAQNAGSALQLSPDEQVIGMQFAAAYKADPRKAIMGLLTHAKQAGIEIEGFAGNPAIDINALKNELLRELSPVINTAKGYQQQQSSQQEAQQEYNDFVRLHPDAPLHESSIANLMQKMNLSANDAYYRLKVWALENQYDWNQPLPPQIVARQQAQQQAPTQQNGPVTRQTPPPLHGGGRTGGQIAPNGGGQQQASTLFDSNVDWAKAIRQTVADLGLNLQT